MRRETSGDGRTFIMSRSKPYCEYWDANAACVESSIVRVWCSFQLQEKVVEFVGGDKGL